MSHYLSQLEGSERAQECIRNDEMMNAHLPDAIRLALAPFAPPAITQAEWDAADLAEDQGKSARRHAVSDSCAVDADLQWLDAVRKEGL